MVRLANGQDVRRHVDHLRKTETPITSPVAEAEILDDCFPVPAPSQTTSPQVEQPSTEPTTLRRSNRIRTAPDRLTYPSK